MVKSEFTPGGMITVNWGFLLLRVGVVLGLGSLLYFSQRFWYRSIWRVTSHWGRWWLRFAPRIAYLLLLGMMVVTLVRVVVLGQSGFLLHQPSWMIMVTGLWFFSAMFAYLAVKTVHGLEILWHWLHATTPKKARAPMQTADQSPSGSEASETVPDPSRRYFFRAATAAAGA